MVPPGVEFTHLHRDMATITQMHLQPGQGHLLTLLDDSNLHLWETVHHNGCAHPEGALSFQLSRRLDFDSATGLPSLAHITVVRLVAAGDRAALGTEGGSIVFLDVPTVTLHEEGRPLALKKFREGERPSGFPASSLPGNQLPAHTAPAPRSRHAPSGRIYYTYIYSTYYIYICVCVYIYYIYSTCTHTCGHTHTQGINFKMNGI